MSSELKNEAARYCRIAADYKRKAVGASIPADKNMYTCLADSYERLANVYEEEAGLTELRLSSNSAISSGQRDALRPQKHRT